MSFAHPETDEVDRMFAGALMSAQAICIMYDSGFSFADQQSSESTKL
jgi:hypothetical protein